MGRPRKKTSSGKSVRKSKKIDSFTLSNEERLELENLQLKEGALRERLSSIGTQQKAWGEAVMNKYGVELQGFVIDVDSGEVRRRELKPVPEGGGE